LSAEAEAVRVAQRVARRTPFESIYGFGTVFAKGLRDSRWAVLGTGVGLGLIMFFTASQISIQFPTLADRRALATEMGALPAMIRGLLGEPINVDRLGGFISWRIANFLPIMVGLWSVLALSGTLASEASRGSLELLATTPISRSRLAAEKVAAHLVGLALAILLMTGFVSLAGAVFAQFPGDQISPVDALSQFLGTAVVSLTAGGIAFVLAPILGRGAAGAIAAIALVGAYVIDSYSSVLPSLEAVAGLSWLHWTADHRPLAGVSDPGSVALVGLLDAVLLVAGVWVFVRRDVGQTTTLPSLPLAGGRFGLRSPARRSFADRLPASVAWGLGIGLYGLVIAASASGFAKAFDQIPGIARIIEQFYPGIDYRSASGVLQLAFVPFSTLLAGLAVAVLVSGWSSDERDGRLDITLSGPLSRIRWTVASGGGVLAGIVVMAVLAGLLVAAGAALEADEPGRPFSGAIVIGLYGAALAGIGIAFGGVLGARSAAAITAGLAIGFYLLDSLGTALRLPDELVSLALSRHLGRPMLGTYDAFGMVACCVLAVGGVVVAAWGLNRRDLGR
jgi:ABC-2 type transport system permease protein